LNVSVFLENIFYEDCVIFFLLGYESASGIFF
jgi:hypothetical protein